MKKLLVQLLYYSGVLSVYLKFGFRNSVTIFMLHGVEDESSSDTWQPAWHRHTRRQLADAIETLSSYFDIVSLSAAETLLRKSRSQVFKKKLVFTFDDGYLNNVTAALPVLQKYKAPGVFYLATGILERKEPYWIDRLDYLFQNLEGKSLDVNIGKVTGVIDKRDRSAYETSYRELRLRLKQAYPKDEDMLQAIDEYASAAEQASGKSLKSVLLNDKWADFIPKAQLASIPALVELGSHTVNHRRVDSLSPAELESELVQSREFVELSSRQPCRHFCYPNGNFSDASARAIEDLGYASAVTTEEGINYPGVDLFKLKRVPFPHVNTKAELLYFMIKHMRKEHP